MQSSCQDDRAWINRPALANAWRPYSSLPFHTDHAWIMCGRISDRGDRSMMARRRSRARWSYFRLAEKSVGQSAVQAGDRLRSDASHIVKAIKTITVTTSLA